MHTFAARRSGRYAIVFIVSLALWAAGDALLLSRRDCEAFEESAAGVLMDHHLTLLGSDPPVQEYVRLREQIRQIVERSSPVLLQYRFDEDVRVITAVIEISSPGLAARVRSHATAWPSEASPLIPRYVYTGGMNRMADPVRRTDRRYTYRHSREWPEDERWELIDGVAWNMSPAPSVNHQRVLGNLNQAFRHAARGTGCEVLFAPVDVFLFTEDEADVNDADTVVQPDLVVVCDRARLVDRGHLGGPSVVVEVLSTYTMRKDLTVKREIYERAGVREYWIVDPGNQSVMIYRLKADGRYPEDPEVVTAPGTAVSCILPEAAVTVPFA